MKSRMIIKIANGEWGYPAVEPVIQERVDRLLLIGSFLKGRIRAREGVWGSIQATADALLPPGGGEVDVNWRGLGDVRPFYDEMFLEYTEADAGVTSGYQVYRGLHLPYDVDRQPAWGNRPVGRLPLSVHKWSMVEPTGEPYLSEHFRTVLLPDGKIALDSEFEHADYRLWIAGHPPEDDSRARGQVEIRFYLLLRSLYAMNLAWAKRGEATFKEGAGLTATMLRMIQ